MNLSRKTDSGLNIKRYFVALLIFAVIMIGLYATIAQVLMFREFLVVFYGNELCIGVIFGAWLFGIAVGAGAGGRIAGRISSRSGHLKIFICILFAMCLLLPLQVSLLRTFRSVLDISAGQFVPVTSLLWSASLIIIPFSITIGLVFPFACTIFRGITSESSTDIGGVYILEGIGALIGGLIFTFVLVSRISSFEIMAVIAIVLFITLILLSFYLDRTPFRCYFKLVCIVLTSLYLGFLLSKSIASVDSFLVKKRWTSSNANIRLMESNDSKYHNIVIGEQEGQFSVYVNGQYDFSFPDQYGYARIAHLVITQHPSPKRVLLIGGGVGGLIREILKHPIHKLDYVELDPKLISMTRKYLQPEDKDALSDKRVTTYNLDGRYFVKHVENEMYDLIFSNTPDPSTALLNRFYTLEFFQDVKKRLEKDGVFAARISSALNYMGEDVSNYTGSVYHTLARTFPFVSISPGQTNYFFCSNEQNITTFDLGILANRYKERDIKSNYFSEFNFYTILQPEQVTLVKDQYKNIANARLNTDKWPITYFFNLVLWDKFASGKLSVLFRKLEDVRLRYFLIPIFILLTLRLIYLKVKMSYAMRTAGYKQQKYVLSNNSKTVKFNSFIAIFCIGFAGIAVEIIIIFAFQNIYGYIYEKMGLIIALFMFGLAIGGFFANKFVINYKRRYTNYEKSDQSELQILQIVWSKVLLAIEIAIVFFILLLPLNLKLFSSNWTGSQFIFLFFITVSGFLTGIGFPIAAKLYLQTTRGSNPRSMSGLNARPDIQYDNNLPTNNQLSTIRTDVSFAAGLIDSADHFGALFGAILTGIIFVPLLGLGGACIIVAMLNLASAILLAHFIMRHEAI